MKTFKIFAIIIAALTISFTSCELNRADYDETSNDAALGGLLDLKTRLVGYVVGEQGPYTVEFLSPDAVVQTETVDVYVQYNRSTDGAQSNKKLLRTITVDNRNTTLSFDVYYDELRDGLTIDGNPLPTSDTELNIGDFFELTYLSNLDNGETHINPTSTKVSVGTRFAGKYRCVDGLYFRIGVLTYEEGDWPSETIIESVDATTYKVVEYFGPFNGNEWYFQIDENYVISYPETTPSGDAQLGNGQPFITCESNPGDMVHVNCGSSNYVELDNVNGADKLYMSFGYYTGGSGPREFYQVMEKIVE